MLALPPLSLYIHIPWCVRKCPYCDFNSHEGKAELPERRYLAALLQDLDADLRYVQDRELHSLFIGGGTPSLMTGTFYKTLLAEISARVRLSKDLECTLEANPGTTESVHFEGYREAGINRLSLGIQSFNDAHLKALGRIHDSAEAGRAIERVRLAGFDNFNLDLMYGLPEQTGDHALADLATAIEHRPAHLSWYQLTLEPNTLFYSNPPVLPPEDELFETLESGTAMLRQAGYRRYEVSAYAQPARQARHNLNYWEFGDYLGIGAGASGKITLAGSEEILRTRKVRQPEHYLADKPGFIAEQQQIDPDELDLEFMMNALRLSQGFGQELYERRTGRPFEAVRKQLEYLRDEGLLRMDAGRVQPSPRGELFLNSLLEAFL